MDFEIKVREKGGIGNVPQEEGKIRSRDEGAAADLFEAGLGFELAAKKLDVPAPAVRKWLYAYRATGRKGLIGMGESRRTYDMETKLAVARAVVDEGMPRSEAMARFGIAAATSLDRWCRLYREGGPEALEPGAPVPCAAVPAPLQLHDDLARLHVPLPSGLPARRISACGQSGRRLPCGALRFAP